MTEEIDKLAETVSKNKVLNDFVKVKTIAEFDYKNKQFDIKSFNVGSVEKNSPTLFLTGGVHGIERIGARLAWSLLKTTIDRLTWDVSLQDLFKKIRLVVVPLVNPVGFRYFMRSNGNGVDLMRNAPIKAKDNVPFLLGGHRFSNKLPWYQGQANKIETEIQALIDLFQTELIESKCIISVDFHSGFGLKDRLWFPYSYTNTPFENLSQMYAFTDLFEETHPYHIYKFEPQSASYQMEGDLWDYLYLMYKDKQPVKTYLPLTLEMGSWSWVRKNPTQLFSRHGVFNPVKEHRRKRTYRRHHLLFDFMLKALNSYEVWSELSDDLYEEYWKLASKRWY